MWTCTDYKSLGPIAQAVCSHFPSPVVLEEAAELDRELAASPRSWETLLRRIEEFVVHYPSLLLHASSALSVVGDACRDGVRAAQRTEMRTRAAALLVYMQNAIAAAINSKGIEQIEPEIPQMMGVWLSDLFSVGEHVPLEPRQIVPGLLSLGRRILMVADDGNPPQLWYALVYEADRLLLALLQRRIAEGTANRLPGSQPSAAESTDGVQLQRAREWLVMLEHALANNERTAADVFLELSAIAKRRGLQTAPAPGDSP